MNSTIVTHNRTGRKHLVLGLILGLVAFATILATLGDVGVTWDEPLYIKAARGYMTWLGVLKQELLQGRPLAAFQDAVIVEHWMIHPTLELHPPFGKFLSGLSWAALRGLLGAISAHRVSNAALFSLLVAMVYWMVAGAYDTVSGVFAALSLMLMPRMFLHAHLANIDTTVAITWFLAMYLFWRYRGGRNMLQVLAIGVAFGLALATKMNAILLPVVWFLWLAFFDRDWRQVIRLAGIGITGLAVFIVTWPWLYHDTMNRLVYYLLMASRFKDRPQYYLGQLASHVPWHYPFVITVAVVPLAIVVMAVIGAYRVMRRKPADPTGYLLLLNLAVPLLVAATPFQAAYSGERHFIPAYPYLACLAGMGFGHVMTLLIGAAERLHDRMNRLALRSAIAGLLALLLVPAAVAIARIHPYELSYYSEVVGGLPGATRMGFETTFWCESYRDALPYLNMSVERGASVWVENPYVLRLYQREGLLREDLVVTGGDVVSPSSADYAVVEMRQTGFYYTPEVVGLMQQYSPVYTLECQQVPLLHIYRLKKMP